MTFAGDLAFGSSNTLQIELAGTAAGEFDRLDVAGDVTLGGTLDVQTLSFDPAAGESFAFLDVGGTLSGEFGGLTEALWSATSAAPICTSRTRAAMATM